MIDVPGYVLTWLGGGVAGGVATLVYIRRYARNRGRDVRALVASGAADWAANCRITSGAELLADSEVTAARHRHPAGFLVATDGRLEWRPDGWSVDVGWRPGSRSLADVRLVRTARRRDVSGLRIRAIELAVPGGVVRAFVAVEAGVSPWQTAYRSSPEGG